MIITSGEKVEIGDNDMMTTTTNTGLRDGEEFLVV